MVTGKFIMLAFQKFSTRKFHGSAHRSSSWRASMKKELETTSPKQSDLVCIYRVPSNMRLVEPKAYRPNNISIGPCHYGAPHLQEMEKLKSNLFRRLFDPRGPNGAKLDMAMSEMEKLQDRARSCYYDPIKLSRDEFLQMMLIDASFIIQLLRDLSKGKFRQVPHYLNRWMLPTIRRELIMLENQLPLFVLSELFSLTGNDPAECQTLEALALGFFYPLLQADSDKTSERNEIECEHFLDLVRSSILPNKVSEERGKQSGTIRSITELKKAGVKIKSDEHGRLLDIKIERKWFGFTRELTIPPLYINDHRGTLLRNIVAFEQCHKKCKPDVTSYLFFFNGLINSAEDVGLLHYKEVLHHCLGSDEEVAELMNKISIEVVLDEHESYLYKVVGDANSHFRSFRARIRVALVHHYFSSWVVGISTVGAFLALYFTFIQTVLNGADALPKFSKLNGDTFGSILKGTLLLPLEELNKFFRKLFVTARSEYLSWGDLRELCVEICLTE
ncbi:hypothetical protein L6164_031733 [Bauhinia variegata]|uniref:Uncharacterized protein n=1 Tax=Bauhinia variegata TaxID=167791 RepID=A0ACB9KLI4_BAUVA|nr:hypothetical protein L6164_031733 [Bauhinia variegata]